MGDRKFGWIFCCLAKLPNRPSVANDHVFITDFVKAKPPGPHLGDQKTDPDFLPNAVLVAPQDATLLGRT